MRFLKLSQEKTIIFAEIAALLLLAVLGVVSWKESRLQIYDVKDVEQVAKKSDFEWSIEGIEKSKVGFTNARHLSIVGWIIQKNIETDSRTRIAVVLQNMDSGLYYKVPTMMKMRKDITQNYYDGHDYDWSGFEIAIGYSDKIAWADSDYEIYLLVKNRAGETMVDTGTTINEWKESEE